MSKKKNTLKDLDEFLKQQAATLVTPARLSDTVEAASQPQPVSAPPASEPVKEQKQPEEPAPTRKNDQPVSAEKLLHDLQALASKEGHQFRETFYDLIIQSVESQNQFSPEDKMLINTALYLKSGDQWKDVIREYWRKKAKH